MGIKADIQTLNTGAVITLFELDLTTLGGTVFRWHSGVNELANDVVWKGQTYSRFPILATGFEMNSKGTMPRPTLRCSNASGLVGALTRSYGDLVGGKVIRRRTLYKYIDAVNFPGGVNASADPNAAFADEIWFVDRKASENPMYVEFELAAAYDVAGTKLPRRQFIQNTCTWGYRSAECSYAGGPVADKNDIATSDSALDSCGKRLSSCKLRFGAYAQLPTGAFPAVGLIR